jgi:hypothetical protein
LPHLGLHGDDPSGLRDIEFELGVTRDGHELDITWLSQDDVVRAGEVNYFKRKRFGAVVACVLKSDRQGDSSKGDGLLTQDHSIKRVWAALELVLGEPQPLKAIEVHEVEVAALVHEGLGESGCPDQRVDYEGKPP